MDFKGILISTAIATLGFLGGMYITNKMLKK
jgi:hypothetical protein